MSSDTEIQALPTDMHPTPPPPPAHSAPFPLSPTTPVILTSDNNCEHSTQSTRPILTPAAPSKRVAQSVAEQASQSFEHESDQSYTYLPQELRQIIKQRRRRERAWHVRLSICTSVICNIESTLLVFNDDIEKEEADIIRNYLQQAIARLAASDNALKFPPIPHHTKPPVTKGSTQEKVIPKKKVLFLRLSQEHEWRKLSPAGIREMISKRLHVSPASIGLIKPLRSGFALSPCSNEAREELLQVSGGLFLSGAKLEPANQWVPLLMPTVPRSINTLQGHMEVTKEMLSDEIERVSSVRPEALKFYGNHKPDAPHRTWLALFTKLPKSGFRVFDESGITHVLKKQIAIDFCKRCNGHHSSKFCSRAPSCGNCGSNMHTQDNCKAATRCRNCRGPHRSDSRRCLARPTRHGAPTKEQLRAYRQAGNREFQATIRARVAEEKASAMEVVIETPEVTVVAPEERETSPPISGSLVQVELTESIIDNTQQESDGSSTDSNMDL
ncbi:putative eka-like protein [Erysiphe necator]|uniref:Putative eka-like protein n=1 Tax=Uncinula necator TaxID=52586 RepID=A0A0B1PFP5_UNCNE|nr:putative eka-like protein [Erysiphe necator]